MTRKQYRQNRKQFQSHNRSVLFDLIMIVCTAGLWLIWMAIRPKKK
jgi:hypothetical protein